VKPTVAGQLPPPDESLNGIGQIVKKVRAYGSPGNLMNQDIQDNLVKLLDAYLEDLKAEADTVTHIVNYINESSAARAALAEQLESYFWTREKKAAANGLAAQAGNTPQSAEIQGKAEALLKGLADFNISQPEGSKNMS
jgi:inorganic triphosphatase YgiF